MKNHGLLINYSRLLSHEIYTTEHNEPGIDLHGLHRKLQAVANEVGHVLHLRRLIIVGEYNGSELLFQPDNFLDDVAQALHPFGARLQQFFLAKENSSRVG